MGIFYFSPRDYLAGMGSFDAGHSRVCAIYGSSLFLGVDRSAVGRYVEHGALAYLDGCWYERCRHVNKSTTIAVGNND